MAFRVTSSWRALKDRMKIEATIQTFQLEEVEAILEKLEVVVRRFARHFTGGAEYRFDVPRLKLEMLVPAERGDSTVEMKQLAQ